MPGAHGRDPYVQKQREMLDSKVHLIEIDLLRAGVHTTAVSFDAALAAVRKGEQVLSSVVREGPQGQRAVIA